LEASLKMSQDLPVFLIKFFFLVKSIIFLVLGLPS
jgi:hypothetical protein